MGNTSFGSRLSEAGCFSQSAFEEGLHHATAENEKLHDLIVAWIRYEKRFYTEEAAQDYPKPAIDD